MEKHLEGMGISCPTSGAFQRVLAELAIERLLYRIGSSRSADSFVLEGATLFGSWARRWPRSAGPSHS